tara:strand:+ start:252 stop:431 length:180 start_codon:yes stop_codon:yes gene_type:complete
MKNKEHIEELIADEMTRILEWSSTLNYKDRQAIAQEYKEWLYGVSSSEDIWVIDSLKPS